MDGALVRAVELLWNECALFAAAGFLILGLDELAVDLIWFARAIWRQIFIYTRHAPVSAETLRAPRRSGLITIFIAAWDESAVIGAMLRHALASFAHDHYRIYVGCYPNDAATMAVVRAIDDVRLVLVIGDKPGPTTKADCLNTLWQQLLADEALSHVRAKAIVLHDAEDVVHPQELRVFDRLIERFALVQVPVFPLPDAHSRWIAGHYCDEFAEAHGKTLVVREALGAALPSAGVGTAFSRDILGRIAEVQGGNPFDATSLTEDYELGLKIGMLGGKSALARLPSGKAYVQVKAHFPATLRAAVRQKARWIVGISLAGYDRLGWSGGVTETWMRMRDRRAVTTALLLSVGYFTLMLTLVLVGVHHFFHVPLPKFSPALRVMIALNSLLLFWRMAVRAFFVTRFYGWREGVIALPRMIVANVIAVLAARRALFLYLKMRRTGVTLWDKTDHVFPLGFQQG